MSENIDVLCALNTVDMPALSKDQNNPTPGLNNFVYMIVQNNHLISGQAGPELDIKAQIGDNVRWRVTSLSGNFEQSVFFYKFTASQGGNLLSMPPLLIGGAGYTKQETVPAQGPMPWSGQLIQMPYFFYQSTVMGTGRVTYQWYFQVNKTSDNSLVGYGMWDPFITVNS